MLKTVSSRARIHLPVANLRWRAGLPAARFQQFADQRRMGACGQPCRCAPGARAGCRPPWYARWATTAARDVPAPRRPRTARARRSSRRARQACWASVSRRQRAASCGTRALSASNSRMALIMAGLASYIELIDDAFSQIARGRGAVDHRLHVQRRRAQVTRDQRLEHRFLAGEMRMPALGQAARSAMSSILAPAYPEAENSCSAASSICATRKAGASRRR